MDGIVAIPPKLELRLIRVVPGDPNGEAPLCAGDNGFKAGEEAILEELP